MNEKEVSVVLPCNLKQYKNPSPSEAIMFLTVLVSVNNGEMVWMGLLDLAVLG